MKKRQLILFWTGVPGNRTEAQSADRKSVYSYYLFRLKVVKALFQAREAADNRGVGLPVVNRYIRHDVGNDSGGVMNVMQGPSARDFELQWIRRRWRHI
jgi:hypothetical protein